MRSLRTPSAEANMVTDAAILVSSEEEPRPQVTTKTPPTGHTARPTQYLGLKGAVPAHGHHRLPPSTTVNTYHKTLVQIC